MYNKSTEEVLMANAEDARRVIPLRLRGDTGFEVLVLTHEEE